MNMSLSKEYLFLFNALTDTEEALEELRMHLMSVQQRAEELFLEEMPEPGAAEKKPEIA